MFFCLKTHLLYMNRLPFLGLLFALLCLVSCRQMNDVRLLYLAEEQVLVASQISLPPLL